MLQFWKKSGHKQKSSSISNSARIAIENNDNNERLRRRNGEVNKKGPLSDFDDEGLCDIDFESTKETSRLSKSLSEVVSDKNALNYFIQFMESKNAVSYILCWLDIDTFKSDLPKNATPSPLPSSKVEHDSLSVSTDCDSYTADSNSLCECSSDAKISISQDISSCDKDISDISPKNNKISSDESNVSDKRTIVENALIIFKKYIAQEATASIHCPDEIRNLVVENICDTRQILFGSCFEQVQTYVFDVMEKDYFEFFLGSDYFCKYQIDVLTSGNVVLDDILYNETALFYFMEFLEQENQRILLEFWIAATNFQQQLRTQKDFFDPIEAQSDAVVLYDKYFSLQAHCPLGFSDKVRFAVEQNICGENGLTLDCFHLPLKIVETVLDRNYLKSFLSSQLFYKYLSELINTVQSNGYSTAMQRSAKSSSDCGSEKSFASSTFLAMEINHCNDRKKHDKANMTIDTRELYDPDALWKRKRNFRLTCGRVSGIGKYETDFEPEPDRKEFNFREVVKKFVSLDEEEKRREDLAWQVAEMIVKDITSVTMGDHDQDLVGFT